MRGDPERVFFSNSDIAKRYPHIPELNVLVVGMPNVGKSTLLNSLRNVGIRGRKSFISDHWITPDSHDRRALLPFISSPDSNTKSAQDICSARINPRCLDAVKVMFRPIGLRLRFPGGDAPLYRERRQRRREGRQVGAYRCGPMNKA